MAVSFNWFDRLSLVIPRLCFVEAYVRCTI
ncbi:hypothetical protein FHS61_001222 [Altererythrobacter atlanticus]|nr:hypothetical protein [Croceibacterium atlanticum]